METRVVNLGNVRSLLAEWEKVRQHILKRRITGFQTVFRDSENAEAIFFGGVYKDDPQAALAATLKLSAAKVLEEDEPPLLHTGSK